jgi:flavin-dependent trigonelline monooxygenase, oxygenase component
MLRRTCLYPREDDWVVPVQASVEYNRQFENLFRNVGAMNNGFPEPAAWDQIANRDDYEPTTIRDCMIFDTGRPSACRTTSQCAPSNCCSPR